MSADYLNAVKALDRIVAGDYDHDDYCMLRDLIEKATR